MFRRFLKGEDDQLEVNPSADDEVDVNEDIANEDENDGLEDTANDDYPKTPLIATSFENIEVAPAPEAVSALPPNDPLTFRNYKSLSRRKDLIQLDAFPELSFSLVLHGIALR